MLKIVKITILYYRDNSEILQIAFYQDLYRKCSITQNKKENYHDIHQELKLLN